MKRRSIAWILSCAVLASSFPQGTFESSAASVVEVETETQESTVQGSAAPIVIEGSEIANAELDSANIDMSTKQSESITETAEPLMTETIETSAAEITCTGVGAGYGEHSAGDRPGTNSRDKRTGDCDNAFDGIRGS